MEPAPNSSWISEYLASHPAYISSLSLEGGVSNFLYRLTKKDGSTVILKHAEPYAAFDKTWSHSIERIECEQAALTSIPAALLSALPTSPGAVEIPKLISYDHQEHNIIMSDCGTAATDLHTAFPNLSRVSRVDCGRRLGQWLAALHKCTAIDKTAFSGNVVAQDRKGMDQRISLLSAGLPIASSGTGTPLEIALERQEFTQLLEPFVVAVTTAKSGSVTHGDFWPGNVMVSPPHDPNTKELLAIIDWESVRLGTGASDVGVFAAEAWLLCHFHSISANATIVQPEDFGMLNVFLENYLKTVGSVTEQFVREAILQFAINLSVGRGGSQMMLPVKKFGVEIVKLAAKQGRNWQREVLGLDWGMEGWRDWLRGPTYNP